jgi:hypothetical protein
MRLATHLHPVPRLRMHADLPAHCEYARKACRGATRLLLFCEFRKEYIGEGACAGICCQCLNMLQERNHGFVVLCCLVYCKQSNRIFCSLADCCIPSSVMTALFFMCCVQSHNLNVMLCIWMWVFKKWLRLLPSLQLYLV